MILSDKTSVRNLVEICALKGIKHVVMCPGSRNAPLTISFNQHPNFKCYSVVDERSAAFFALGIAQQTKETVAITCTSGTAALNFSPAIAEAFYQKVPLLILTADRPKEWIDQMDGQTIRQSNIYNNYIKKSFDLPIDSEHKDDVWMSSRLVSEAVEATQFPEPGPVHINLPFREPLYNTKDYSNQDLPQVFETVKAKLEFPEIEVQKLQSKWKEYKKILIITGLLHPNDEINKVLNEISNQDQVAILTETTSNVFGENFNRSIDRIIGSIEETDQAEIYKPELLVTIGGPVVSKKVKAFLRKNKPTEHWHINASNDAVDTFQSLTKIIPLSPEKILPSLVGINTPSNYRNLWIEKDKKLLSIFKSFIDEIPFCDLKAFNCILKNIPKGSSLQLANSTAIRYSNLFDKCDERNIHCYSNRGTSGIDGTISTAVGAALMTDSINTVITGDLSFFYDSNALWIKPFPKNIRIIIINNSGGNIFRIIDGPNSTQELEQFFEAKHNLNAKGIAETFNINYTLVEDELQLEEKLTQIYSDDFKRPCIVEIKTNNELNPDILKQYFRHLKQN